MVDLGRPAGIDPEHLGDRPQVAEVRGLPELADELLDGFGGGAGGRVDHPLGDRPEPRHDVPLDVLELRLRDLERSEEHTSELQSLMRISYAVFCLKKKKNKTVP